MNSNADTWTSQGTVPRWTITDRLRKSREVTGLDQSEFARDIGCSRATVSNYERGLHAHTRAVLMTWAMRSGVPLEWLLTGQQSAPHPGVPDEGREVVRREGLEPPTRWLRDNPGCEEIAKVIPLRRLVPLKVLPLTVVPLRLVPALSLAPDMVAMEPAA